MQVKSFKIIDTNNTVSITLEKRISKIQPNTIVNIQTPNGDELVKVLSHKGKEIRAKRFRPIIYVWTTQIYKKFNIYKVGIVNWQSVDSRMNQTDTTGVLEKIEVVSIWPLDIKDPKITAVMESEIHNTIGLFRKDKAREAVQADYKTVVEPVIKSIIDKYNAKHFTNAITLPTPRPHQADMAELCARHFVNNDRGWIQSACGSGKTFTGFFTYDAVSRVVQFERNLVVIMVPNLQLVTQTLEAWKYIASAYEHDLRSITIGSVKESIKESEEIANWIDNSTTSHLNLIVSTYQSSNLLSGALLSIDAKIDYLILDEVHRLAGEDLKSWKRCLHDTRLPARKRLSMTASPVEYTLTSNGFSGMENTSLFGEKLYTYNYTDALFDDMVAPIQILGMSADQDIVQQMQYFIEKNKKVIQDNLYDPTVIMQDINDDVAADEGNIIFFIQLHNTLSALRDGVITHPIVYANSQKRIDMFMACLKAMAPSYGVTIDYADVFTSANSTPAQRIHKFKTQFAPAKIAVVGNVYCLQEGIDFKEIDSVVIVDKRSSGPAIVQIMGRGARVDAKNPDKVAKVLLPIFTRIENGCQVIDNDYMETTRDWMINIAATDADLVEMILHTDNFDAKSREGIDLRDVKPATKKLTSISGVTRQPQAPTLIALDRVDFTDFIRQSKIDVILDSGERKTHILQTQAGLDQYISNNARAYVLNHKSKVAVALESFNAKNVKRYAELIRKPADLVSEFATNHNIDAKEAKKLLKQYGLDNVESDMKSLKQRCIVSQF